MRPRRLLVVTNDYPPKPGGIQRYLGSLVDAYPGPVRVLAPADGPADGTERGEAVVVRYRRRFMWPGPATTAWIIAEARSFRADAVLFGAPHPLPAVIPRLKRAMPVRVGILCHGAEVTIPAAFPPTRWWLRRTLARADVVFGVSRFTSNRVARLIGRPVVTVGAGVEVDEITPPEVPPNNHPPVVGCVSRFVPRKGQQRLIVAAARLGDLGTPVQLLLVGRGRTEARLRRLAARNGVDVRFEVDVAWEALPDLYRSMDLFCMPCRSRWGGLEVEGLGLVFLEAAAAGLPVLAGSSGGSPETVDPGVTGYVVDSVDHIVEGVQLLTADRAAALEMGRRGRTRVMSDYVWDEVIARVNDGFNSAGGGDLRLDSGTKTP